MYHFSSKRANNPESTKADENVTTGEENKTKTVCTNSDVDESGDKCIVANGKSNYIYIVKPAQEVTSIKQSPVLSCVYL